MDSVVRKGTRRDLLKGAGYSIATAALGGTLIDPAIAGGQKRVIETDLCVYGGCAGGAVAAIQMHRLGGKAVVVEPSRHIGGLTSGGLGQTDIGNKAAIGGISREFYARVLAYYTEKYGADSQQVKDCTNGFRFEPSVAESLLNGMLKEVSVPVYLEKRLKSVKKRGRRITEIAMEDGTIFRAKMFIDATYEGDLMAKAGVAYHVGREANSVYGETLNGVQFGHRGHMFQVAVDPYRIEGDPKSGLLWGVSDEAPGNQGDGDKRVQAYNFRMCLTDDPAIRVPFPKPDGYEPERYELLLRYLNKGYLEIFGNHKPMPNRKTDTNNHGAFGSDNIGRNWAYPEGDQATRDRIFRDHVIYQQGLMYFLANDPRVPDRFRETVSKWGLAKDEFTETGNWPHQLYVREARRMISDYVMTEHNCRGKIKAEDPVGLGAYNMDSHHVRRIVVDGKAVNEGDVQVGVSPYPVSYRSIVPKQSECENLLVPVCLSSSHISYGSIRMEPVFMILGQSAATAAYHALQDGVPVQKVAYSRLREQMLKDKQVLEWTGAVIDSRSASTDPKSFKGVALDDSDGKKNGDWLPSSRSPERRIGHGYIHDGNTNKGAVSISYTPDLPSEGEYEVVLISVPNENRASNVPVEITVDGKMVASVRVDQKKADREGFASLGKFKLPKGRATTVSLSNRDTDGFVVADGIQFIPSP